MESRRLEVVRTVHFSAASGGVSGGYRRLGGLAVSLRPEKRLEIGSCGESAPDFSA